MYNLKYNKLLSVRTKTISLIEIDAGTTVAYSEPFRTFNNKPLGKG